MNQTHEEQTLVQLLLVIWRNIDMNFKSRYRVKIWQIFQDRIQSCARQTNKLSVFASRLCFLMESTLGSNAQERQATLNALSTPVSNYLLNILREQAPYYVLLLRAEIDKQKGQSDD